MDINDVSSIHRYRSAIEQIIANAERARLRKGQNPRDHPSPQQLVGQFMFSRTRRIQSQGPEYSAVVMTHVPAPYPPSVRFVNDLQPLMISQMRLEEHHRGGRTKIRILTPPDRITAVMAIAEDEEGTAILLTLYNLPDEAEIKADDTIRPQSVCIIKEPFFKAANDGSYCLRVDHVSDIIWLLDTDERIPPKWRKRRSSHDANSQKIRMLGNDAARLNNWVEAEQMYSSAVRSAKSSEQEQLALLNRSLANLRLRRPECALKDASMCSQNEKLSEKCLFRQARSFYELQRFKPCLEKLQLLVKSYPKNTEALSEMARTRQRLREEEDGHYRFSKMYKQSEANPPIIDCATYSGPVAVRPSPGRGNGLFTTRSIKAGELLLCEKAFGYVYVGDDDPASLKKTTILMNISTKRTIMGGHAHLITQIAQKLYHNREKMGLFMDLHHGDYDALGISEIDGQPIVDTFLIDKIISLNTFGAPRTSRKTFLNPSDHDKAEKAGYSTCGIWPLASRINHSCVTNCYRAFIGDMQIVRACQDIEANTELFFPYLVPSRNMSYEKTQQTLAHWGFVCTCQLCEDKKSTTRKILKKREALTEDVYGTLLRLNIPSQVSKAQRLLQQLEKTYPHREGAVHLEPCEAYFTLGVTLTSQEKPAEAIEMFVKGFEALGYKIVACPPRKDGTKEPKLLVERWGQVDETTVIAFASMSTAYAILQPELYRVTKQYAETAYSIIVGEKETFATSFPDLP